MPTALAIRLTAESDDRATANWSDGSARFHVWIVRRADGWTIEETIYKNPPLASDGKPMRTDAPGYFDTRQLDLTAKANAAAASIIRELATPEALDELTAAYTSDRKARAAWEARAARVAYLSKCVAAIQNASADDLAESMVDANPDTAARAEMLRTAARDAEAAPTAPRTAEIRGAARVLHFASPEELQAAAPPANEERTDSSGRRYIDLTPTWAGVLPVYMAALENGNATGRAAARADLQRMAGAADSAVLISKIAKA